VAQTREAYERSNKGLESALDTLERSFDAAGQGAVALKRKVVEIAQRKLNSGFDLASSWREQRISLRLLRFRQPFGAGRCRRSRLKLTKSAL
jgi:hypothetical protein